MDSRRTAVEVAAAEVVDGYEREAYAALRPWDARKSAAATEQPA